VAQVHKTQRIDIRLSIAQALVRLAMRISIKSVEFMWRWHMEVIFIILALIAIIVLVYAMTG